MDSIQRNKKKFSSFIIYGPFLGTLFLTIAGHSDIYLYEPMRFLKGMVTPSIIFPMLGLLLLITPFGYLIGITPAFLTERLFEKFIKHKLSQAHFFQALMYGCGLGLIWAPLILYFSSFTLKLWTVFTVFQFCLVLPTTLICTLIEWRRLKNEIPIDQNI